MKEEMRERLVRCFTVVFDQIDENQVPLLQADTCELWDSLANVMLMSVIQQEFSIDISLEETKSLNSFEKLMEKVTTDGPNH
jgi:acyl carrier protein